MAIFLKDPAAVIDYAVDWAAGYLQAQTVTDSSWSVAPDDPDGVVVVATVLAPSRTMATLGGGQSGRSYRVTNHVALSDGRRDERSLVLRVEDR